MNGGKEIINGGKFATNVTRISAFVLLSAANTVQALTTDPTIFFQKLWIYPGATATNNKINANAGTVYVGDQCLVPVNITLTSLSINASTTERNLLLVTANKTAHGFVTGTLVTIAGASPIEYNGTWRATRVDANNFTFEIISQPVFLEGGITGTITATGLVPAAGTAYVTPDALAPTDLPLKYELPLGMKQQLSSVLVQGAQNDGVYYRIW